jgi:DNA-binding MurR/RpiR family transcriptional regulator
MTQRDLPATNRPTTIQPPAASDTREADQDPFAKRLRERGDQLTGASWRVLRFIDRNRIVALASSAAELGRRTRTSDATVIRAVQMLGFRGLPELRQALTTSLQARATPAEEMRRTLSEVGHSAEHAISSVLDTHEEGLKRLRDPVTRAQMIEAVSVLHAAERLVIFGIGPSAPMAQYTAFLLQRTGRRSQVLDRTGTELADQLLGLSSADALLMLAYGPAYRELVAVLDEAERLGVPVVLITDGIEQEIVDRVRVRVSAARGRAEQVALHGTTLVCLEALVLAMAASREDEAIGSLERLGKLRQALGGSRSI